MDTVFGTNGIVATSFTAGNDVGRGVALQGDGKIIVAGNDSNGDFALARFNTDGTLDTGFGAGGKVTTPVGSGSSIGYKVAVQADGKILVTGTSIVGAFYDTSLVRFDTDGSLDATFGTGGIVTTAVSAGNDGATDLALQADGKIVVAGSSNNGSDTDFAVTRYNTDGSLDAGFGTGGSVTTPIGTGNDFVEGLVIQSDGKILVAGWRAEGDNDFALARFNADGSLDATFGTSGKVTASIGAGDDRAYGVAVQADGKILVTGRSDMGASYDFSLLRLNEDGSPDATFGSGGKVTTDVRSNSDYGYAAIARPDGSILVAGLSNNPFTSDFALVRYTADGSLDTTFNPANGLDGAPSFTEGDAPVVLDADVSIFDQELSAANNFSGATLTLARNGGADAQDAFSATGSLSALTEGGSLVLSGVTVGTVTANSAGTLLLTFNGNATQARVDAVMRSIAYANGSDAPPGSVQIDWTFSDGNSGAQGSGGALAANGSTTVSIIPVNDAPSLGNGALAAVAEDTSDPAGDTIANVFAGQFSDVDAGSSLAGVAIIGNSADPVTEGRWQYSTNAGANWFDIGTVADDATALALSDETLARFVPAGDYAGTPAALTVRGIDDTYAGGFSSTAGSETRVTVDAGTNGGVTPIAAVGAGLTTSISPVNDAPSLDNTGDMTLTPIFENQTDSTGTLVSDIIASAGGDRVTDAEGDPEGIAITAVDDSNGTWQYSTDGGAGWHDIGTVGDASARLLTATAGDLVRFVPDTAFNGTASFSFRAWDGTDGGASGDPGVDASVNGGATAFSADTETAAATIASIDIKLYFSTLGDVVGAGTPGADGWGRGDIVAIGDPGFALEADGAKNGSAEASGGTLYSASLDFLNTANTASSDTVGDVQVTALHYVGQDITVGNTTTIDLRTGDILFSISHNSVTFQGHGPGQRHRRQRGRDGAATGRRGQLQRRQFLSAVRRRARWWGKADGHLAGGAADHSGTGRRQAHAGRGHPAVRPRRKPSKEQHLHLRTR